VTRAALLDTGVLIALCDPSHAMHATAMRCLESHEGAIATCPIVENGAVRILSQPRYSETYRISTAQAAAAVAKVRDVEGYDFWSDSVSLLDESVFSFADLMGPSQVTDAYLLALAVSRDGVLVTLDTRLQISAVRGATAANLFMLR
jgi:uncharacterized protein